MARRHIATLLFFLSGAAAGAAPGSVPDGEASPDIQRRHEQLRQLDESIHPRAEAARGEALAAKFRELYADAGEPGALRASDEASLHMRFDDAQLANFYHTDAYALTAMQSILAALERRHAATPEELSRMRNALLAARRFDEAASFSAAHPEAGFAPLPRFVDAGTAAAGQPTVWRDAGAGRFERIGVDLGPTQVLVTAGCHFSDDAAREIAADPVLGPAFRAHATWLGMPPGAEDPADVAEWNHAHPQAPMLTLYDRAEWPMFPHWRMPTFFVVRNGRIVGTVVGWKPADAHASLVAMLRENGLLPGAHEATPATARDTSAQGEASSSR